MLNSKEDLTREQALALLEDFTKRWLAHDGLWFQSIERERGMEEAIHHDIEAWRPQAQKPPRLSMQTRRGSGILPLRSNHRPTNSDTVPGLPAGC